MMSARVRDQTAPSGGSAGWGGVVRKAAPPPPELESPRSSALSTKRQVIRARSEAPNQGDFAVVDANGRQ